MSDEKLQSLMREYVKTKGRVAGGQYYQSLSRKGRLDCPTCGWHETLADLHRQAAGDDTHTCRICGHGVAQHPHEAKRRLEGSNVIVSVGHMCSYTVPHGQAIVHCSCPGFSLTANTVAWGRGVKTTRDYETAIGSLGSIEACARCGTVYNPQAPAIAFGLLNNE